MRLIRLGGAIVWIAIGAHVLANGANSRQLLYSWAFAYLLFGAAFAMRITIATLVVQVAAVIAIVLLLCNGFEGTLLVLVAMQLGGLLSRRSAISWIAVQSLLLFIAIAIHWSRGPAMLLVPPYFGFQLLAFFAVDALARESAAHSELRAVNRILGDSTRIAERLRISRELHDVVGHHLTALSLNLEAALHRTDGEARKHIETAQSLAKNLLNDVREIATDMQASDSVDLQTALQALVRDMPRPDVHLDIDSAVRVHSPERAHIIVRCVQEIVTNAARHSSARNLWIRIAKEADAVRIQAHDDGRGAIESRAGLGLRSMRDRVESAGGHLRVETRPDEGFEVSALVPATS
jgi:signal transduction histidine kinase